MRPIYFYYVIFLLSLLLTCHFEKVFGDQFVQTTTTWTRNSVATNFTELTFTEPLMMFAFNISFVADLGAVGPVNSSYQINFGQNLFKYSFIGNSSATSTASQFQTFEPMSSINVGNSFTLIISPDSTKNYSSSSVKIFITHEAYTYSAYMNCFNKSNDNCSLTRSRVAAGPHYFIVNINSNNLQPTSELNITLTGTPGVPFSNISITAINGGLNIAEYSFTKYSSRIAYPVTGLSNGQYLITLLGNTVSDVTSASFTLSAILILPSNITSGSHASSHTSSHKSSHASSHASSHKSSHASSHASSHKSSHASSHKGTSSAAPVCDNNGNCSEPHATTNIVPVAVGAAVGAAALFALIGFSIFAYKTKLYYNCMLKA